MWSTCGPMELGPAFSKVLTIKGGGHRPGGQKGGVRGSSIVPQIEIVWLQLPPKEEKRRKIGVAWSATRVSSTPRG